MMKNKVLYQLLSGFIMRITGSDNLYEVSAKTESAMLSESASISTTHITL
jgi:hypothetical protein